MKIGEEVILKPGLNNPEDSKAVKILTKTGDKLGYVPAFYSGFMFDVIKNGDTYTAKVEKINIHAKPQHKVSISVICQSKIGEFQGREFDIIERFELI